MHPLLEHAVHADWEDHAAGHRAGTPAYDQMRARDGTRRALVHSLLTTGVLQSAEDFYGAARLFQHSDDPAEFEQAHQLALKAAELGHPDARWLAAAALDRWLVVQGQPQRYGTQYLSDGVRQRLMDVDPATTDEERARWNVPPLAEQRRKAEEATRNHPPIALPPKLPDWYRQALERWQEADSAEDRHHAAGGGAGPDCIEPSGVGIA